MTSARAAKTPRRILCLGMPVRDMLFRVDNVPARGAKVPATQFAPISGGNAPNAAVAIARLGGLARLCGPMGEAGISADTFILDQLAREGIDLAHIVRVPGAITAASAILIDATGERSAATYRDPKLWQVVLPASDVLLDGVDAVLTEDRCAPFVAAVCRDARARGIPVVVDADRAMPADDPLLEVASHLIFSAEALRATTGKDDLAAALTRLKPHTQAFLGATDGERGALWLALDGTTRHTLAFPVETVDTLGAGDVFHGAFALAMAEAAPLEAALTFAAAAAALKCSRVGGPFGAPQRADVEGFLARVPVPRGA